MSENEAVEALYAAHRRPLVRYAQGIVKDCARAEDVVQEAFIKYQRVTAQQTIAEPVAYLYRVVRNLAFDGYRGAVRERRIVDDASFDVAARIAPADTPSQEAMAVQRQDLALIEQALNDLPERTRTALEMRRSGGYRLREIADHLGISVPLAHKLIADAIEHCKERLDRK